MHDDDPHDDDHGDQRIAAGAGHNAIRRAAQWQTPHDPGGPDNDPAPVSDEARDLDLVEKAFCEGFAATTDPTSFLRLAGIPFSANASDGRTFHLLRVEHQAATDIGNITPHLGGGSFRYSPLPARLTSRRGTLRFIYFDGVATSELTFEAARNLQPSGEPEDG